MNFKHMDFQKKTMLALVVLLIVILVYAVVFAAPVRRKSEEFQEELVRTERQIREQKDLDRTGDGWTSIPHGGVTGIQ